MIVQVLLILTALYLACGLIFAIAFAVRGVRHIDPHALQGSRGFRVLIIPGATALWPLLLKRWLWGVHSPPPERTAHRLAALRPPSAGSRQ